MKTNEELFAIALTAEDEDEAWSAIAELHTSGSQYVFERACQLCVSADANERRVGADILGQLGTPDHIFPAETLALLLNMLAQEQEPEVLYAIAVALGHRGDPRAIGPLVALKQHPDALVRDGVVYGLMGHEDELAIQTLIDLSSDPETHIRDWATFSLGSQIESDTPAIREALIARLADEDSVVRGEAMVGLAHRGDRRMIEPLLNDLNAGLFGSLAAEAAAEIGDERLYQPLVQVREEWQGEKNDWLYKELEEAIERCRPVADAQ